MCSQSKGICSADISASTFGKIRPIPASAQPIAPPRRRLRLLVSPPATTRLPAIDVAKLDDKNASSHAVFGDFEQIDNASKPGITGKGGRNVREGNLEDLLDDDLTVRQGISAADLHVRSLP